MADENSHESLSQDQKSCILVCQHRSCLGQGSAQTLDAFEKEAPSEFAVEGSECMGQCSSGPTVRVTSDETWYCQVKPEDVPEIVERHLKGGQPVDRKLNPRIHLRMYF
ncbi:MAG: (2Fe-2S) ferredoxin domain-containing protein [Cyanobacteriota bacterium]|nr:(2Fe-2S) ferredoxin domain-containing protein [Cyanobacteriota bacterium]